jgi:RNA ligase (TIGR02306 family)
MTNQATVDVTTGFSSPQKLGPDFCEAILANLPRSPAAGMRKLVTVRRVGAIRPIPDADAIECATVEGWDVVIKKGEFRSGDNCVYFEIDSFLPLGDERYAFLAKNKIIWNGKEGIRLRTIKLRGQVSQGLILPIAHFPELAQDIEDAGDHVRELDFSEKLGIEKWEAPIPAELAGDVEGPIPSFVRKTDQERIQNLPEVLQDGEAEYEVTIKLDGSSMTAFRNTGTVGVCGRNWWLKETEQNSLWRLARKDKLLEALDALGRNLALQGEIIGEGIQGNPEKLRGQEFRLFDIWDIDAQVYLGRGERGQVVDALTALGAKIKEVPFIEVTTLRRFGGDIAAILAYAEGKSLNPAVAREGIVFKRLDGGFSFKAISNTYLLKHGDR